MIPLKSLVGNRYGRVVVISFAGNPNPRTHHDFYNALCDCGTAFLVRHRNFICGNTTSCGCAQKEMLIKRLTTHGRSKTKTHRTWLHMRERCNSARHPEYHSYGGRGIKVCERWNDFSKFLEDMGEHPPNLSLERKDNNVGYSPENCVWATSKEQTRNMRRNINFTMNGETLCLKDWCARLGLHYHKINARVTALKWPIEKALELPPYGKFD